MVIDLAGAKHHASDLVRIQLTVTDNIEELTTSQVFQRRSCQLVPQNPLGTHNNQRATHGANRLTPQQMKNLRWSGWVYHLHIVLSTELQEALEARRGVLWTLPFEAVRQ